MYKKRLISEDSIYFDNETRKRQISEDSIYCDNETRPERSKTSCVSIIDKK
jgi:hypothetical protein